MINSITLSYIELLKENTEEKIDQLLTTFSCSKNQDVENYIKSTFKQHHKQNKSRTYFIFDKKEPALLAYFTIALKSISIHKDLNLSATLKKKMQITDKSCSVFLIGQLAKNDTFKNKINLKEILYHVFEVLFDVVQLIGGRQILIECQNNNKLIDLYKKHGFSFLQQQGELSQLMIYDIKKV